MTYEEWFAQLKLVGVEKYDFSMDIDLDPVAWRTYFEAGCTPEEAILEDFSYA